MFAFSFLEMGKLCILCVKSFQEERDIIYFIYLTFFNLGELCAKTDRERGPTQLGMGVTQLGTGVVQLGTG
jgi:hypothetical protein